MSEGPPKEYLSPIIGMTPRDLESSSRQDNNKATVPGPSKNIKPSENIYEPKEDTLNIEEIPKFKDEFKNITTEEIKKLKDDLFKKIKKHNKLLNNNEKNENIENNENIEKTKKLIALYLIKLFVIYYSNPEIFNKAIDIQDRIHLNNLITNITISYTIKNLSLNQINALLGVTNIQFNKQNLKYLYGFNQYPHRLINTTSGEEPNKKFEEEIKALLSPGERGGKRRKSKFRSKKNKQSKRKGRNHSRKHYR